MYSAALTAMVRHCGSRPCSYNSRSALATKYVHTRFGDPIGTNMPRPCQWKLYPQHQYGVSGERSSINRWIIYSINCSRSGASSSVNIKNADRNSARAFGFCVCGMRNNRRRLIALLFSAWVSTRRGIFLFRMGKTLKSSLLRASYGSSPAQLFSRQYAKSLRTAILHSSLASELGPLECFEITFGVVICVSSEFWL